MSSVPQMLRLLNCFLISGTERKKQNQNPEICILKLFLSFCSVTERTLTVMCVLTVVSCFDFFSLNTFSFFRLFFFSILLPFFKYFFSPFSDPDAEDEYSMHYHLTSSTGYGNCFPNKFLTKRLKRFLCKKLLRTFPEVRASLMNEAFQTQKNTSTFYTFKEAVKNIQRVTMNGRRQKTNPEKKKKTTGMAL